ncbi:methylated-DNA--[protein]-cysteine S-methyltransferase [Anoxybacterium hadale]|uniref:Methylated-DNA--[protein]-cysteine S-methyltransferase n=1 Tax=Anoxybacterium hadale TaxID=3408580 RepID=A0ACD1ADX4_9FIRM|nr:methylated-DNA--[protein]-cysteine S-methyltransferase [Clostridiales bacterium]
MANVFYYELKLGPIGIAESDDKITHLFFQNEAFSPEGYTHGETAVLTEAAKQLKEYFDGQRKEFELPLAPAGTEFMQRVWNALLQIPYGETRSYKQIAKMAGNEKACRAVGMANNRNPISIFIPCHRVIGANGALVGYGGGLDKKIFLLELERR